MCLFPPPFLASVGAMGSKSHPSNWLSALKTPPNSIQHKEFQMFTALTTGSAFAHHSRMLESKSSSLSPPRAPETHRSVINERINKRIKGRCVVWLMAQTVTKGQEAAQLPSHSFCVRSWWSWLIAASVCVWVCECVCMRSCVCMLILIHHA